MPEFFRKSFKGAGLPPGILVPSKEVVLIKDINNFDFCILSFELL